VWRKILNFRDTLNFEHVRTIRAYYVMNKFFWFFARVWPESEPRSQSPRPKKERDTELCLTADHPKSKNGKTELPCSLDLDLDLDLSNQD